MEKSTTKAVLLTVVITGVVTSLVWVGIGIVLYKAWTATPPPFVVTNTHPETVEEGEVFTLEVEVMNNSAEAAKLGSIDVYDDFLGGFRVVSVDPKPESKEHRWGFASYYFTETIDPGKSFTMELELEAVSVGWWYGDVDCCTPLENSVTSEAEVEVVAKP